MASQGIIIFASTAALAVASWKLLRVSTTCSPGWSVAPEAICQALQHSGWHLQSMHQLTTSIQLAHLSTDLEHESQIDWWNSPSKEFVPHQKGSSLASSQWHIAESILASAGGMLRPAWGRWVEDRTTASHAQRTLQVQYPAALQHPAWVQVLENLRLKNLVNAKPTSSHA